MKTTDVDLKKRVLSYLMGRQVPALRQLQVQTRAGTVILSGRVGSFYEKQLALNCCRRVAGVYELVDRVEV